MEFDKKKYLEIKKEGIKLIKNTCKKQGFIADGLIDPDTYEKEKFKVLVILAESYGYVNLGVTDIERQPDEDILGVGKPFTARKISILLWLLYKGIEENRKLKFEGRDFPDLFQNKEEYTDLLQETMKKIGWINVKKISKSENEKRQDYEDIYNHSKNNKDILRMQIDSLCPDLIIICSDPVFYSLYDLELLGKGIEKNKKNEVQINNKNQIIFYVSHPSCFRYWSYKSIYGYYKKLHNKYIDLNLAKKMMYLSLFSASCM